MKIHTWIKNNLPPNSVIVEAGVADGVDTVFFSNTFHSGFVYGFEPDEELYNEAINKTNMLSNVSIENVALGEKNGKAKFYVSDRFGKPWGSSSLLKPKDHLWFHKEITFKKEVEVDVVNLDSWANKNGVKHLDLMWLDLQGAEPLVLKNAPNILSNTKYLYTEVSLIDTYKNVEKYNNFKEFLLKNNFIVIFEDLQWEDMGNVLFKNISI